MRIEWPRFAIGEYMTERQGQASIQWPAIPNDFTTFLSSYVPPKKKRKSPTPPAGKIAKKVHTLLNESVLFWCDSCNRVAYAMEVEVSVFSVLDAFL